MTHIEKRIYKRTNAVIECHCCNINYFGTITDISETGMFLRSEKISLPLDSIFEISIPLAKEVLRLHVKVRRITKSNGYYDGLGVELMNPPQQYLEFLNSLNISAYLGSY